MVNSEYRQILVADYQRVYCESIVRVVSHRKVLAGYYGNDMDDDTHRRNIRELMAVARQARKTLQRMGEKVR